MSPKSSDDKWRGHGGSYVVKDGKRTRVAGTDPAPPKRRPRALPAAESAASPAKTAPAKSGKKKE